MPLAEAALGVQDFRRREFRACRAGIFGFPRFAGLQDIQQSFLEEFCHFINTGIFGQVSIVINSRPFQNPSRLFT